jgi:hypothetical protein
LGGPLISPERFFQQVLLGLRSFKPKKDGIFAQIVGIGVALSRTLNPQKVPLNLAKNLVSVNHQSKSTFRASRQDHLQWLRAHTRSFFHPIMCRLVATDHSEARSSGSHLNILFMNSINIPRSSGEIASSYKPSISSNLPLVSFDTTSFIRSLLYSGFALSR